MYMVSNYENEALFMKKHLNYYWCIIGFIIYIGIIITFNKCT
jgi:hypothetical protein